MLPIPWFPIGNSLNFSLEHPEAILVRLEMAIPCRILDHKRLEAKSFSHLMHKIKKVLPPEKKGNEHLVTATKSS